MKLRRLQLQQRPQRQPSPRSTIQANRIAIADKIGDNTKLRLGIFTKDANGISEPPTRLDWPEVSSQPPTVGQSTITAMTLSTGRAIYAAKTTGGLAPVLGLERDP